MIEKKVHYVWFGDTKPLEVERYIQSWKKYLPDYELIEWNEKTFDIFQEMKSNFFLKKCYEKKLWAFVADYIRVKVLYEYGGIYLDTDVEVVKNFDSLLDTDMFLGYESKGVINLAVVGVIKKHPFFREMLNFYQNEIWTSDMYIITSIATEIGKRQNIFCNSRIHVYPEKYFYPFNHDVPFSKEYITADTYAIHWWGKSWNDNPKKYFLKYKHFPWYKKYSKHTCKLINYYIKKLIKG